MSTALADLALPPRPRLTRLQLILRLAAGQSRQHIAELFEVAVAEVARRAEFRLVRMMVSCLGTLLAWPREHRLGRLALRARSMLADALGSGLPGAALFAERCWARGQDPALVAASRAERRLREIAHLPQGLVRRPRPLPSGLDPWRRQGWSEGGDTDLLLERLANRYAGDLRDSLLMAEASLLELALQTADADPDPDERQRRHDATRRHGHDFAPETAPPAGYVPFRDRPPPEPEPWETDPDWDPDLGYLPGGTGEADGDDTFDQADDEPDEAEPAEDAEPRSAAPYDPG
jgi:hypothetical protein